MDDAFYAPIRVYGRKLEYRLTRAISLSPKNNSAKKRALVSYVVHPFTIFKHELDTTPHTNPLECLELVSLLLEAGYAVDVIDWTDTVFLPRKKYDVVIDVHQNLERLRNRLPDSCLKIFYITGAHWMYQNSSEYQRLMDLKKRRGAPLVPRRTIVPANNIEHADFAIALGNGFARSTYSHTNKEIHDLPLLSTVSYPNPQHKNFDAIKNNFVWIGGGGAVHKGLDLVLEACAALPEVHLTICGPVQAEKDFTEAYRAELTQLPNIRLVGRINVRSKEFKDIADSAVALIYPSCSEGQAGSVITALQAGLIPLVTPQSGVDTHAFGITIDTPSVQSVTEALRSISTKSASELASMTDLISLGDMTEPGRSANIFSVSSVCF